MKAFRTEAWLLCGISSVPGELVLKSGVLSFVASDTGSAWPSQLRKLERRLGAPGLAAALSESASFTLFRWPVETVMHRTPWYYFGGGIKITGSSCTLAFSFGRPGNESGDGDISSIGVMREHGKQWREALNEAASSSD